jgi:hypothetical protein
MSFTDKATQRGSDCDDDFHKSLKIVKMSKSTDKATKRGSECDDDFDKSLKIAKMSKPIRIPEYILRLIKLTNYDDIGSISKQKERLSSWIQDIYTKLSENMYAKLVLMICSYFPDLKIVLSSNESNSSEKYTAITFGDTIMVAVDNFENHENERFLMGLIIHEFCHFAINVAFRNFCKPYYKNDEEQIERWEEIKLECMKNKNEEKLIDEVFNYDEDLQVNEIVVRK